MWGAYRPQHDTGPGSDRITSVTDWVIWRRKCSRTAERGFWPRCKNFFGSLSKDGLAKCLYIHQESLTVSCRVSWAWTERVQLCSRQIILLSRRTKTYASLSGPGNLYRLYPTPPLPPRSYWLLSLGSLVESWNIRCMFKR